MLGVEKSVNVIREDRMLLESEAINSTQERADVRHRPPLKWAGGKRWLVPDIHPIWKPQRHRRLVEPFTGGLAVTLGMMPTRALLNDILTIRVMPDNYDEFLANER